MDDYSYPSSAQFGPGTDHATQNSRGIGNSGPSIVLSGPSGSISCQLGGDADTQNHIDRISSDPSNNLWPAFDTDDTGLSASNAVSLRDSPGSGVSPDGSRPRSLSAGHRELRQHRTSPYGNRSRSTSMGHRRNPVSNSASILDDTHVSHMYGTSNRGSMFDRPPTSMTSERNRGIYHGMRETSHSAGQAPRQGSMQALYDDQPFVEDSSFLVSAGDASVFSDPPLMEHGGSGNTNQFFGPATPAAMPPSRTPSWASLHPLDSHELPHHHPQSYARNFALHPQSSGDGNSQRRPQEESFRGLEQLLGLPPSASASHSPSDQYVVSPAAFQPSHQLPQMPPLDFMSGPQASGGYPSSAGNGAFLLFNHADAYGSRPSSDCGGVSPVSSYVHSPNGSALEIPALYAMHPVGFPESLLPEADLVGYSLAPGFAEREPYPGATSVSVARWNSQTPTVLAFDTTNTQPGSIIPMATYNGGLPSLHSIEAQVAAQGDTFDIVDDSLANATAPVASGGNPMSLARRNAMEPAVSVEQLLGETVGSSIPEEDVTQTSKSDFEDPALHMLRCKEPMNTTECLVIHKQPKTAQKHWQRIHMKCTCIIASCEAEYTGLKFLVRHIRFKHAEEAKVLLGEAWTATELLPKIETRLYEKWKVNFELAQV